MPWRQVNPMDERVRFVVESQLDLITMSDLCRKYGISRKTGYKWLQRYDEHGLEGFKELSRAPLSCPHKTPDKIASRLIELRQCYPVWGPKKLVALLEHELGVGNAPSPSTAGAILSRHGLVERRKKKRGRSGCVRNHFLSEPKEANDVWAVDFKGWFRTRDSKHCHPLTVTDLHSRYLLCCKGYERQSLSATEKDFKEIFKRYGLPKAIRMDNGTPFGSTGLGGLTSLSVKLLRLGINVEYIEPGKPQQNGSHERMHRTLKLEATLPPEKTLSDQQKRFDSWMVRFNELRPHESLSQKRPADCYNPSARQYIGIPAFEYPSYFETRYVRHDGMFSWEGELRFLGRAFERETVGLIRDHENRWLVFAGDMLVGWLPESGKSVRPLNEYQA